MFRFLTAATAAYAATVSNCGEGKSVFKVSDLSIAPVDPAPGANFSLQMTYTVPDGVVVTGGTAEYDVTWNFIPFEPTVEPLCQNIPCPLEAGTYTNTSVSAWPTGISGLLNTQMKWIDSDGSLLACVGIDATLASPAGCNHTRALRGSYCASPGLVLLE